MQMLFKTQIKYKQKAAKKKCCFFDLNNVNYEKEVSSTTQLLIILLSLQIC